MAKVFISFVHEDAEVAAATKFFLQALLPLKDDVFLSSDRRQIYAGDMWLAKIREGLAGASLVLLLLSNRSSTRPWVNFEAGAAWLTDKTIIPCCFGGMTKAALPHPYSAIQAVDLPTDAHYLIQSVHHHLNLGSPPPGPGWRTIQQYVDGKKAPQDAAYEHLEETIRDYNADANTGDA